MRNVLFVAYRFPPCGGTPVQRPAKFAKFLPEFGYRPLVLTADDDQPHVERDETFANDLRGVTVFPCRGYERYVVRLPRRLGLHPLTAFWLRPDCGILGWVPCAARAGVRIAAQYPVDVIYTTVDPFSSVLLGARLKRRLGVPWIVDYRDPWTDDLSRTWPTRLHYWWETRQERRALASADAIVVVTPTMKALLARRYPQWADKIHVICNGFDPSDIPASAPQAADEPLHIGHIGSFHDPGPSREMREWGSLVRLWVSWFSYRVGDNDYSTHSPYYLLHAVRALLDEEPQLRGQLKFSFVGRLGETSLALIRDLQLQDVVSAVGYLPHADSVRYLSLCDVFFLPMQSPLRGRRGYNLSGKLFEYLATGKPILAAVVEGDIRDLIRNARAGWCVEPHDVTAIKRLLKELVRRKRSGTLETSPDREFIAQFQRQRLTGQLAGLFDQVLARRAACPAKCPAPSVS